MTAGATLQSEPYHYVSHWRVTGTVAEVTDVFRRGAELQRWWPAVYLETRALDEGDARGVGYLTDIRSKGFLPYVIRWRSRAVETWHPHGFRIEAAGDFEGHGTWRFEQDGACVNLAFEWRVRVNNPLLRWFGARWLAPVFALNHRWSMRVGERSLELELARRRARTPDERARVPEPPRPTTTSLLPWLCMAAGLFGAGVVASYLVSGGDRSRRGTSSISDGWGPRLRAARGR